MILHKMEGTHNLAADLPFIYPTTVLSHTENNYFIESSMLTHNVLFFLFAGLQRCNKCTGKEMNSH